MTETEKLLCEVFEHLKKLAEQTGKCFLPYELDMRCMKKVLHIKRREAKREGTSD